MKTKSILTGIVSGFIGSLFGLMIFFGIFSVNHKDTDITESKLVRDYYERKNEHVSNNFHEVIFDNSFDSRNTDFSESVNSGIPAVVHVKTQYNQPSYTVYDFIFGTNPRYSTPVMSSGSGVIISADGFIVTNNHVIENAEIIEVVLNNKQSYSAKLVGRDATTDIALLKIGAEDLPFLTYGDSDELKVGEWVIAIGNPFNLTSTATAGIVSAKARNINIVSDNMAIESFIQTDAAVNPGNSGGALININGDLVGINTAIASKNGSFVGYSFAIPVNIVRKVVADLVEFGEVQRAYLGLNLLDVDAHVAKELDIDKIEGVYVSKVWKNGAGDIAGIEVGDIIIAINSDEVNSSSELLERISQHRPGEVVTLIIKRAGKPRKIKLVLQNKYGKTGLVRSKSIDLLGARFENITQTEKSRFGIKDGVKVTDVIAGKFAANGIKKDFIIVKVNSEYVNSVEEIENLMKNTDGLFIEGIYPNGVTAYYAIKI